MGATHDPNITIVLTLDASPAPQVGFGKVLLLVPLATNSLGGARAVTIGSLAEGQSLLDDGFISAATMAAVTTAFSQRPKPAEFMIGYVDLVGGETYATGLLAVQAYDDSFYGVTASIRTDSVADIVGVYPNDVALVALSTTVEALTKILAIQSKNTSILDAGLPASLSALATRERTLPEFHTSDAQWMDVAHLARVLTFNPDVRSAPFAMGVAGVDQYSPAITSGQRTAAQANNFNVGLPYGGAAFFIDPGKNATGRAMDEIVTADWLEIRLQEDISREIVKHASRGEKLAVSKEGQNKILAIILARLKQGVGAGHFLQGQTNIRALEITDADRDAGRLRFEGEATLAVSGRLVTINFAVGRSLVNVEA